MYLDSSMADCAFVVCRSQRKNHKFTREANKIRDLCAQVNINHVNGDI